LQRPAKQNKDIQLIQESTQSFATKANALVGGISLNQTHSLDDLHARLDTTEYRVFLVEERCGRQRDEEL
jgi:hypothetical protein